LGDEERNRERVRLLADRYGILARELLAAELPALGWTRLARSMRSLELAGELVGGHFVAGLTGLQFASPGFLDALRSGPPEGAIWWHAATDPASLCGVDLPALKAELPRRQAGNWVVWRGDRIALVVRRGGRDIDFRVPPSDAGAGDLLAPLAMALTRDFDPARSIDVETVNGEPAARCAYREAFEPFAVSRTTHGLRLRRRLAAAG
jgi:ATP-dependent helicase Lhr and Lhr-like helicase